MEYRLKRQITIIVVLMAVVLATSFFYFLSGRQAVSCFDGKLNQGEEKIDCGGPSCAPCVEFYFEDIQVLLVNFVKFEGKYDAFALVKNPNSQYGASDLRYKLKFYDKDNKFIVEIPGKSYIAAGETKYFILSNLDVPGEPAYVRIDLEKPLWQAQTRTNIKLPIFSKKYESTVGVGAAVVSQISGVIENQSNYSFVDVDLSAILMDKDDNYLAVNKTKINNLRAGERRSVSMPWFSEIKGVPVAKVILEASTNVLDDANILR